MDEAEVPLVAESTVPSDEQSLPTTTAADSFPAGAPIATSSAADEILLRRHYPAYFFDGKETIFPADLNRCARVGCHAFHSTRRDHVQELRCRYTS